MRRGGEGGAGIAVTAGAVDGGVDCRALILPDTFLRGIAKEPRGQRRGIHERK